MNALLDDEGHKHLLEAARASGFNQWLQFDVLQARDGWVELEVDVRPEMRQHFGTMHGGCLGAMADVACAYAAGLATRAAVVTSSYAIHFLAPVYGKRVRVTGRAVQVGKRQVTVEAQLFDLDDNDETASKLCAMALATVVVLGSSAG